jgi:ATP-dependent RNA helicase DeaD
MIFGFGHIRTAFLTLFASIIPIEKESFKQIARICLTFRRFCAFIEELRKREVCMELNNIEAAAEETAAGGFAALGLDERILRAISDMGFDAPSPIQEQAIPTEKAGRDVIGQAQTGTGKTAAFGLPLLEKIDPAVKKLQAVILCPTRELAIQVSDELHRYAKYLHGVRILPVYGGQDIVKQIRGLKDGTQVMVGTPGRVMDHMRRGTVKFDHVHTAVLDEADEMLDMGFIDDMNTILSELPEERQTVMFSATMPREIVDLANRFLNDPAIVRVAKKELTVPEITQYYYDVRPNRKTEVLCRLLDLYEPKLSVVFCNTKRKVDELVDELKSRGYYAEGLHGDLSQAQRDRVMGSFRKHLTEILVATDVVARGIDVEDIDAVFNYDIPQDDEYYVHRIGRTGRAGKSGTAYSLVVGREVYKLRDIQRYCRTKIIPQAIPSLGDINEIRSEKILDKAVDILEKNDGNLKKMFDILDQRIFEDEVSSMDLAAALLMMHMGEMKTEDDIADAKVPRNLDDLGRFSDASYGRDRMRGGKYADKGRKLDGRKLRVKRRNDDRGDDMVRLFINVGRNQHVKPGDIVGAIAGEAGVSGSVVGAIDIKESYSFVDVDRRNAEKVMRAMMNAKIRGLTVHMEKATGEK